MSDEKKIIIDEDWKTQVAAEKEAAEKVAANREADGEPASAGGPEAESEQTPKYPPASFEMLVTMFASEAMSGLGQFPHPLTGKQQVDLEQARYAIDMLEMLADKTKGNLAPAEESGLRELLHQLRMTFVAVRSSAAVSPPAVP